MIAKAKKTTRTMPALITTDNTKRGVFFAWIDPNDAGNDNIVAEKIQMCVYWSTETRGVLGLAANGPNSSCRITAPVKSGTIKGVTFVCEVSPNAVKAWESQPWRS